MSKKVLIMPTPEERERFERSAVGPDPEPTTDILALQTLMDLERALGRLETAVAGLERSTAQHGKDLNGLGKVAHTTKAFGQLALAVIAGGGVVVFLTYLSHHLVLK